MTHQCLLLPALKTKFTEPSPIPVALLVQVQTRTLCLGLGRVVQSPAQRYNGTSYFCWKTSSSNSLSWQQLSTYF
ncbi:hypothetical protein DPEC_G00341890 [Dallia pectoralis]|uniref:Uncharacterized protein n=1 Tax=Dallia pectoralis TaxID=75939 RepID=A0ACC2F5J9_DALPE|nr:hypothetical protein DPEC_G00341890 [Dallia pectoralis]